MTITLVEPTSRRNQWRFRLHEHPDRDYYYTTNNGDPAFAEVTYWDPHQEVWESSIVLGYMPVDPTNPQQAILSFYKQLMLEP